MRIITAVQNFRNEKAERYNTVIYLPSATLAAVDSRLIQNDTQLKIVMRVHGR